MTDTWNWPGSRWWRFDLHTHTPASYDFKSPFDFADFDWISWINAAQEAKLNAVAITDHNTAKAVNPLKKAAEGAAGLIIFPGVEITASSGTHLLLILDPESTSESVSHVLSQLGISDDVQNQRISRTKFSVEKILDLARDENFQGLFLGAHVNETNGLLKLEGEEKLATLKHEGLTAVEVTPRISPEEGKFLYGLPQVGRKIPQVYCSDGHRLEHLGRRFTWIKMTTPNVEGLRLALLDGEDSLRPVDENTGTDPNAYPDLAIESVQIEKAKYQGRSQKFIVPLNPWFNSIIGGRGTGKSSLIDFCRKTFRRDSELDKFEELKNTFDQRFRVPEYREDEGFLTEKSIVKVVYRKNGEKYVLSWNYDGSAAPINRLDGDDVIREKGDVRNRFPVRIFSQKQLFQLAQSPNALLTVIDDSKEVEAKAAWQEMEQKKASYIALRARARELTAQGKILPDREAERSEIQRKLKVLQKSGHSNALREYRIRESQDRAWKTVKDNTLASIKNMMSIVENIEVADLILVDGKTVPELSHAHSKLVGIINMLKVEMQQSIYRSEEKLQQLFNGSDLEKWAEIVVQSELNYQDVKQQLELENVRNPNEYSDLVNRLTTLDEEINNINEKLSLAEKHESAAEKILESYRNIRRKLSESRCKFVQENSGELVQIEIKTSKNHDELKTFLRSIFAIDRFERDYLEIENKIKQQDNQAWSWNKFDLVVQKLQSLHEGNDSAWDVQDKRFIQAFRNLNPEQLDHLKLYCPDDKVQAGIRQNEGDSKASVTPLKQGSPGQQTAALLDFVLGYGSEPIILDQPEDDLDNALIYKLVVRRIKEKKSSRQILVVTHNPNIVVHGDAELVVSFEARSGETKIICSGGLQEQKVRDEICRVMEGGRDAFRDRYRRIMLVEGTEN